jgi:hypothetical protein
MVIDIITCLLLMHSTFCSYLWENSPEQPSDFSKFVASGTPNVHKLFFLVLKVRTVAMPSNPQFLWFLARKTCQVRRIWRQKTMQVQLPGTDTDKKRRTHSGKHLPAKVRWASNLQTRRFCWLYPQIAHILYTPVLAHVSYVNSAPAIRPKSQIT